MDTSRGERLMDALAPSDAAAAAELRSYLHRLERVNDLARCMYEHEIALRRYSPGEYQSCTRCSFTFRAQAGAEFCPFCLYQEARPGRTRTPDPPVAVDRAA